MKTDNKESLFIWKLTRSRIKPTLDLHWQHFNNFQYTSTVIQFYYIVEHAILIHWTFSQKIANIDLLQCNGRKVGGGGIWDWTFYQSSSKLSKIFTTKWVELAPELVDFDRDFYPHGINSHEFWCQISKDEGQSLKWLLAIIFLLSRVSQ